MTKVTYVDNSEILNEKRKINAYKLLSEIENPIVEDIADKNRFAVRSGKTGTYYEVMFLNAGTFCNCIDYTMNCDSAGFKCKHIQAIEITKQENRKIPRGVLNL